MAVRNFDIGDSLNTSDGGVGNTNQALTKVILFQTDDVGGSNRPIFGIGTAGTGVTIGRSGSNVEYADNDELVGPSASLGITAATWYVAAMSKAAGAATPRFHAKQLGAGSWVHSNATGSITPPSATADRFTFGRYPDGASDFDGRLAVTAFFKSALSDGDIEDIESEASSAFLVELGAWEIWHWNQTDVGDDVVGILGTGADQNAIVGTDVVGGMDPAWDFSLGDEEVNILVPTFFPVKYRG